MNRREALQQVAWLMGGAISAPAVLGVLSGCTPKAGASWKPAFLTEAQGAMVAEVAELMIPRTETPGAQRRRHTGVHRPDAEGRVSEA